MYTDEYGWGPDLAHFGNSKLILKKETEAILGCAFDVLNEIGHGLHEKIYENVHPWLT